MTTYENFVDTLVKLMTTYQTVFEALSFGLGCLIVISIVSMVISKIRAEVRAEVRAKRLREEFLRTMIEDDFVLMDPEYVEPLDVANAGRGLCLLLTLDKNGLNVSPLHADGDGNLVEADPRVTDGVFREEGQYLVAVYDALGNGVPPIVPCLDLALVKPDFVAPLFQICFDAADKLFIAIMSVAEEDAQRREGLVFLRYLAVLRANPEFTDLSQRLIASRATKGRACHAVT